MIFAKSFSSLLVLALPCLAHAAAPPATRPAAPIAAPAKAPAPPPAPPAFASTPIAPLLSGLLAPPRKLPLAIFPPAPPRSVRPPALLLATPVAPGLDRRPVARPYLPEPLAETPRLAADLPALVIGWRPLPQPVPSLPPGRRFSAPMPAHPPFTIPIATPRGRTVGAAPAPALPTPPIANATGSATFPTLAPATRPADLLPAELAPEDLPEEPPTTQPAPPPGLDAPLRPTDLPPKPALPAVEP